METIDPYFIHPEENGNMTYWSRKWRVSPGALRDAILSTGTLDTSRVKQFLRKDSWLHHPVKGSMRLLKTTVNFIF